MRPVTSIESVTAGLKCPPEMCPTAVTMIPIASPFASAWPTRIGRRQGRACAEEDQRERADELRAELALAVVHSPSSVVNSAAGSADRLARLTLERRAVDPQTQPSERSTAAFQAA